jgi:hypothetical protein
MICFGRLENRRLKEGSRETDQTLEELGQQLSWAKLQLDTLKVSFYRWLVVKTEQTLEELGQTTAGYSQGKFLQVVSS